jgi:hypothetical protein
MLTVRAREHFITAEFLGGKEVAVEKELITRDVPVFPSSVATVRVAAECHAMEVEQEVAEEEHWHCLFVFFLFLVNGWDDLRDDGDLRALAVLANYILDVDGELIVKGTFDVGAQVSENLSEMSRGDALATVRVHMIHELDVDLVADHTAHALDVHGVGAARRCHGGKGMQRSARGW